MVGVDNGVDGGLRPFSISEVAGSPLSQNNTLSNAVFISRTFFDVPSQHLFSTVHLIQNCQSAVNGDPDC